MSGNLRTITLGGGCFWCTAAVYEQVEGVTSVESGYGNGHVIAPTYEQVCGGESGHAEVVRVLYDPARVGLRDLLEIFFVVHDPTTLNRQGNDVGTQYRSGIYVENAEDEALAKEVVAMVDRLNHGRVVTEIRRLENYSAAEAVHQHYHANHPGDRYCALVVAPKLRKFRQVFAGLVRRG